MYNGGPNFTADPRRQVDTRQSVFPVVVLLCLAADPGRSDAQSAGTSAAPTTAEAPGAAVPTPPATVIRTAGGVTIRAVRIPEPLRIDGRLEETHYSTVPAISDFIQQEPEEGEPATEKTEAWIFFDNRNIYVAERC